jgi:site-specific DNA-methyltransferase (adenine-specific)
MMVVTIGASTLYRCDCMDYMRGLPDKAFDIAIVDPPYGINAPSMSMGQNKNRADGWARGDSSAVALRKGRLNSGGGKLKNRLLNTSSIAWDDRIPNDEYFEELFRVSINQIVWGGNYFDLGPTRCVICWDKCQPWENFSQWEMAWTSFDKPAAHFSYSNTGGANKETKIHPTQKPVALYLWLLSRFSTPGQRVLDTHLGSGSSAIAANNLGYEFVGCELDAEYFAAACQRIENAQRQVSLFDPRDVDFKALKQADFTGVAM